MTHLLSIIIPAYNEERFIGALLEKVRAVDLSAFDIAKEIVVVDDHSSDRTGEIAASFTDVKVQRLARNGGKGTAVRTGLRAATGDLLIIQDADLEYDPNDYVPMIRALLDGQGDAVYGSRYLGRRGAGALRNLVAGKHPDQSWAAYVGGRSLSLVALAFTGRYLTDTVTALKLFRREVVASLDLQTTGFELDHEISAKIIARGYRIAEVPIHYFPRSKAEGKKIGLRDWFRAAKTFCRFRNG